MRYRFIRITTGEARDYLCSTWHMYAQTSVDGATLRLAYSTGTDSRARYRVSWGDKELYSGTVLNDAVEAYNEAEFTH